MATDLPQDKIVRLKDMMTSRNFNVEKPRHRLKCYPGRKSVLSLGPTLEMDVRLGVWLLLSILLGVWCAPFQGNVAFLLSPNFQRNLRITIVPHIAK